MAALIRIEDGRGGYHQILDYVLARGQKQDSRNGPTLEVTDLTIELADPTRSIPVGINRKGYSQALAALEGLQLVAGKTYDDLMVRVAPNTEQFTEEDGLFHGAYGRRIEKQMQTVIEKLKKDPDTRQAVVTIWDPKLDAAGGKKDHPCTTQFNWRVRNGKLLQTTTMRASDAHWGWPYDIVMFSTLQLAIANYLGVECGPFLLSSASFHVYEKDVDKLRSLLPWNGEDLRLPVFDTSGCKTWKDVQKRAREMISAASDKPELAKKFRGQSDSWYYLTLATKLSA